MTPKNNHFHSIDFLLHPFPFLPFPSLPLPTPALPSCFPSLSPSLYLPLTLLSATCSLRFSSFSGTEKMDCILGLRFLSQLTLSRAGKCATTLLLSRSLSALAPEKQPKKKGERKSRLSRNCRKNSSPARPRVPDLCKQFRL